MNKKWRALLPAIVGAVAFCSLLPGSGIAAETAAAVPSQTAAEPVRSADWLAMLPAGDMRRKLVLGCTPCHQMGPPVAFRQTREEWEEIIGRMKEIDHKLDLSLIRMGAGELSEWLAANARMPDHGFAIATAKADMRVYAAGVGSGFYHDMTVVAGKAWIADYFGNKLHAIDVNTGAVDSYDIPVDVPAGKPGGAHQIDITRSGELWMTFTKSEQVIRFDTKTHAFKVYSGFEKGGNVQYFVVNADRYIYEDAQGGIYMTHFSREIISRLDPATGAIKVFPTTRTEGMTEKEVHLYAAVADSKGRLWYTETHGNRFGMIDPATGETREMDMAEPWAGPKRLAIDNNDVLWIPELATGKITVYDTRAGKVTHRLSLPIPGDFPYAIRRNRYNGDLWVTGSGSDSLYRLDPASKQFSVYRLPHRGAYTRTIVFEENGDVWTNYASFPNTHTQKPFDNGVVVRIRPQDNH